MEDVSLHILDIAENSINAGATRIEISLVEDRAKDLLSVEISDNGRGISGEIMKKVLDPFYTTRTTRKVGMGLSLLAQSAREAGGDISIKSQQGAGTTVSAWFQYSHIDRRPVGNIADTMMVLITGSPDTDFVFRYEINGSPYLLDTAAIRAELEGVPLNAPPVIAALRRDLREFLDETAGR